MTFSPWSASSRPASNCGLMSEMIRAEGRNRAAAAGRILRSEMNEQSMTAMSSGWKGWGNPAGSRVRALVRSMTTTDAFILERARKHGIPAKFIGPSRFKTKLEPELEQQFVTALQEAGVELVALAGYMRVVKAPLLKAFAGPDREHPSGVVAGVSGIAIVGTGVERTAPRWRVARCIS